MNIVMQFDTKRLESSLKRAISTATKKKQKEVIADMKENINDTFRYAVKTIVPKSVANFAPSEEKETKSLVSGDSEKGRVGTSDGSRFIKNPEFKFLQQALLEDARFSIDSSGDDNRHIIKFYLTDKSYEKINREIGFAWLKRIGKRGVSRRSTQDSKAHKFWDNLLYTWEYGGVFTVTPREINAYLSPEKGVRVESVTKTIKPYRMFERGFEDANNKIMQLVKQRLLKRYKK